MSKSSIISTERLLIRSISYSSSGKPYDPIYTASIQPNNVHLHTVFSSPNGMLTLVSVTPFWAVALKLVRYTKWDPGDICLLLRSVIRLSRSPYYGYLWNVDSLHNMSPSPTAH